MPRGADKAAHLEKGLLHTPARAATPNALPFPSQ